MMSIYTLLCYSGLPLSPFKDMLLTKKKKRKGKEWGVAFFSSNVMSNNVKLGQGGHSLLAFRVTIDTMLIFFLFILLPKESEGFTLPE